MAPTSRYAGRDACGVTHVAAAQDEMFVTFSPVNDDFVDVKQMDSLPELFQLNVSATATRAASHASRTHRALTGAVQERLERVALVLIAIVLNNRDSRRIVSPILRPSNSSRLYLHAVEDVEGVSLSQEPLLCIERCSLTHSLHKLWKYDFARLSSSHTLQTTRVLVMGW